MGFYSQAEFIIDNEYKDGLYELLDNYEIDADVISEEENFIVIETEFVKWYSSQEHTNTIAQYISDIYGVLILHHEDGNTELLV